MYTSLKCNHLIPSNLYVLLYSTLSHNEKKKSDRHGSLDSLKVYH